MRIIVRPPLRCADRLGRIQAIRQLKCDQQDFLRFDAGLRKILKKFYSERAGRLIYSQRPILTMLAGVR